MAEGLREFTEREEREERFIERMPEQSLIMSDKNLCRQCVWYTEGKNCLAFPKGIPAEIWDMKVKHTVTWPNQRANFVWVRREETV